MPRTQLKEFYGYGLILIVLIAAQLYLVYTTLTTSFFPDWRHYLGFAATLLAGGLWALKKPQYLFYALGLTIVLGYENLIGFTPALSLIETRYYLSNTALPVSYQEFSMYMLVFWAYVAHDRLRQLVVGLLKRD